MTMSSVEAGRVRIKAIECGLTLLVIAGLAALVLGLVAGCVALDIWHHNATSVCR